MNHCVLNSILSNKILVSDPDFFQNIPGTQKLVGGNVQDLLTILQPRI